MYPRNQTGYLPETGTILISDYQTFESELRLTQDELIVGAIAVRRLTLEEMVEAGIDFSDPENMHTFSFTVTVKLQEKPWETSVLRIFSGNPNWTYVGESVEHEEEESGGKGLQYVKHISPKEPIVGEMPKPVFAYVTTTQTVSWLKDMFGVQMGILNAADSQFVMEDTVATLDLPEEGVSLAKTLRGQSCSQSLGDVAGQECKSAYWVVKGDRTGIYELAADITGTLMPFGTPVSARFETQQKLYVTTGEGIYIHIIPESAAYIGEDYYIQFVIENKSNKPLYNFTTSIGCYTHPSNVWCTIDKDTGEIYVGGNTIVVSDPSTISQSVVIQNGQAITFQTLYPGQQFYGTYCETFEQPPESEADPDKVYYKLVQTFVDSLEAENLGVKISSRSISSHIRRSYVEREVIPNHFGDPIDLSSGAFTDAVDALSVMGGTQLSVSFSYDSRAAENKGDLGYGWSHDYEYRIEENNGTVRFYTDSTSYAYFVKESALKNYLYGEALGDETLIAKGEKYSYGDYVCLYNNMSDYKLTKHRDNTYTVTAPSGMKYCFDEEGRLVKLIDETGKSVSLEHSADVTVVTEDISGKRLYLHYNEEHLITSVSDDCGRAIKITYDADQNISAITNVLGDTVKYTYDDRHRIVSESSREGVIVINEYDEEGRVTQQTDALGNVMTLSYTTEGKNTTVLVCDQDGIKRLVADDKGQILEMENADGGIFTYAYDSNGNLICEKNPDGNAVFKEYDSRNNLVKFTDAGNLTTTMTYDSKGNVKTVTGTEGREASYSYNSRNLMTSMTDSMGMVTHFEYNADGLLIRENVAGLGAIEYTYENGLVHTVTDCNGNTTTFAYDDAGNRILSVDSQGNVTQNEYDELGHLLRTTDAMGNTTQYSYNYLGKVTSVTDALGNTATYEYDRAGRLIREYAPDGTSVGYDYDAMGRCIATTYPDGTFSGCTYDVAGNLVSETLPDGTQISYTYDMLGRRISETDVAGNTIRYAYYPNGSLYEILYPDGSEVMYTYNQAWKMNSVTDQNGNTYSYEYDAKGNLTMERDALGNQWNYEYDRYGRLVSETDANGNTTRYGYDANGNCIEKTNALGVSVYMEYDSLNRMTKAYTRTKKGEEYSITYTYDALGRVLTTTDEMGNTTCLTYDAAGNVISVTDAEGVTTMRAAYDAMGRMESATDALGVETRYRYDVMGNILEAVELLNTGSRTTSYTYDSMGRVISVTDPLAGVTQASYDIQGNLKSLTDANGGVTEYNYDSMGRLTETVSPLGNRSAYTYNAGGLLTEFQNARGQTARYTYDAVGRITSVTDELGTVYYTYDPNGNVLTVTDDNGTITRQYDALNRVTEYTDYKGNTVRYGYDEIGNLISLTYPGGEIVRYTYYKNGWLETVTDEKGNITRYSYDARGNLTHTERSNGTEELCTYDEAGRLISQKDIRGEEVLTEYTYAYDDSGNITAVEGTETTDTGEGISRLIGAEMTYDAENRLITYNGKNIRYDADGNMTYGPVNGVMSELVYDCRNRLVSAGGITYTYDAEKAAGETTTLCIYGNGLVYEYTGDIYLYHHYNNLGSTMKLTDARGRVAASFTYGVYGELLSGDTGFTRFLYNGRCGVTTDDNGLYYMRQRYYNPVIKRFVNQDILTGSVGNSQSLNRYSYVQGNPVSYTDPFGLSPLGGLFTGTALVHGVLGVLGCLPGLAGAVFNGIDAWVYAAIDKDYYMATISGLSALSMGFGSIAKWAKKAAVLSKGTQAGKVYHYLAVAGSCLSTGIEFAQNGFQMAIAAYDLWDTYTKNGQTLGREDLEKVAAFGLSATATVLSGVSFAKSSKELAKALEEDGVTSRIKRAYLQFANDNRGYVDLDALARLGKGGSNTEIPWSSGTVSDAARQLEAGAKSVTVKNRSQAEELFLGMYQGDGYVNVTGMDAMDAKNLLGGKGNTYHWDDIFGSDGYLVGHGAGNPDAQMPHLQIHPQKGSVIRIFFDN